LICGDLFFAPPLAKEAIRNNATASGGG